MTYAIIANIAYSMGPLVDMIICRKWGVQFAPVGPALFRYGFVFAVGVTLIPVPVAFVATCARLLDMFT